MAYIGKEPIVGNFQVCDAISVVNGQASYTMQVSSTNVVPESVNHMLVSLNGILQKPGSSFTISGSTITFASALATGDVIDFIMLLGNVLDLGVPSDATVTDAKANFVSTSSGAGLQIKGDGTTDGTLQLNCRVNSHGIKLKSPPHSAGQSYTLTFPSTAPSSGKALVTDGSGNLSFSSAGGLNLISTSTTSSGVSEIDITSGIDSTYTKYMISIINLHPASDAVVRIRFFKGTGGSQAVDSGSNYRTSMIGFRNDRSTELSHGASTSSQFDAFLLNTGSDSDRSFTANLYLINPANTTFDKLLHGNFAQVDDSGRIINGVVGCRYLPADAITGLRFFMSSGNIDNAIIKLYGLS